MQFKSNLVLTSKELEIIVTAVRKSGFKVNLVRLEDQGRVRSQVLSGHGPLTNNLGLKVHFQKERGLNGFMTTAAVFKMLWLGLEMKC